MEIALRYELIQSIPEIANTIYATNAPENMPKNPDGTPKPYLVYYRTNTDPVKTLDGYTGDKALSFVFSAMAIKYSDMKSLSNKIEIFLMSAIGTDIGATKSIHVKDLKINNISETWESALGVNRGIIDFTIYY